MAKDKEKKLARIYYVEQGKTAKECAELVGVTEKTMGDWVSKFGWQNERDTLLFSANERINNIKAIINHCAEEHLRLQKELTTSKDAAESGEIRSKMATLSDEAAKWNKALLTIDKNNKISLEVYLTVMDDLFKAMQAVHPDIYMKLVDFQNDFINKKAIELG